MTDPLAARFEALLEPGRAPDWADVRRRARRSRRPLLLAAAALVLFVAAPAVAIGVRSGVLSWGEAEPAPPPVVLRFGDAQRAMDQAFAQHGLRAPDLGILGGQARIVPLADGTLAYVAPERTAASACSSTAPPTPARTRSTARRAATPSSRSPRERTATGTGATSTGTSSPIRRRSVQVVLDDGTTIDAPVTWIGPPIDAGLFFARIDADRYVEAVVLRDADGHELARDGHLGPAHRQMAELKQQARAGRLPTTSGAATQEPGGLVSSN